MKKINQILVVLIVLICTIGFASATTTSTPSPIKVDIISDAVISVTLTHIDLTAGTNATFTIRYNGTLTETDELIGSWDGSTWDSSGLFAGLPLTTVGPNAAGEYTTTWIFSIKDNTAYNDDTTQMNTDYDVYFEVFDVTGVIDTAITPVKGSATTDVIPVPEFPTLALPVAAILGLAFIFQRRREED